jgi:hypothetical protein
LLVALLVGAATATTKESYIGARSMVKSCINAQRQFFTEARVGQNFKDTKQTFFNLTRPKRMSLFTIYLSPTTVE